jgi:hypothetical protein
MKPSELKKKLIAEGCNENNFAVLSRGNDAFCLDKKGNEWVVFYSERGCDSDPIFRSESENDACDFFFKYVTNQQHCHLVGFFKNESEAKELESKLLSIGVKPIRNDIPAYKTANDPRYRVFVVGKDIFKVRERINRQDENILF